MYLFYDTETTGLPLNWDAPVSDVDNWPRLVQIGWIEADEIGAVQRKSKYIIRPDGFTIPPDDAAVHGITTERAQAQGSPIGSILREFTQTVCDSILVVAHNASFDTAVVSAELLQASMKNELTHARIL